MTPEATLDVVHPGATVEKTSKVPRHFVSCALIQLIKKTYIFFSSANFHRFEIREWLFFFT